MLDGATYPEALEVGNPDRHDGITLEAVKKATIKPPPTAPIVGFLVLNVLVIFFVPKFEPLFKKLEEKGELPSITTGLLATSHFLQHHGWWVALLVVGAAVSTTLAVWATRAERLAEDRLKSEKAERERAVEAGEKARQAEWEGRRQLVGAKLAQSRAGRWSRQPGQRFAALAALKKAADIGRELEQPPEWFDRLRTEAIAALCLPDLEVEREWNLDVKGLTAFTIADSFERYAFADWNGNVSVRRLDDHAELYHLPGEGPLDW